LLGDVGVLLAKFFRKALKLGVEIRIPLVSCLVGRRWMNQKRQVVIRERKQL